MITFYMTAIFFYHYSVGLKYGVCFVGINNHYINASYGIFTDVPLLDDSF